MQTNFQSIEGFLHEVEKRAAADDLAENLVRIQIETQERNRSLNEFFLRAGFRDRCGDLYQIVKACGREPPDQGKESGSQVAVSTESFLRHKLEKLMIEVREGEMVG